MNASLHITPEDEGTSAGGGGPEDDPRTPRLALRSQGLLTLAFGLALGVAFMVLFFLIKSFGPTGAVQTFVEDANLNLWRTFLVGLIGGTITAGLYNFLVLRRLNLFGLESNRD